MKLASRILIEAGHFENAQRRYGSFLWSLKPKIDANEQLSDSDQKAIQEHKDNVSFAAHQVAKLILENLGPIVDVTDMIDPA